MVPDYVTASGYTQPLDVRSKVGDGQSTARVGLVEIATGDITWLDLSPDVEVTAEDSVGLPEGELPDLALIALRGWNRAGTLGLVEAVSYDFKHRGSTSWTPPPERSAPSSTTTTAPGSADPARSARGWMPDGESVWFVSERSGYAHLYTVAADGR